MARFTDQLKSRLQTLRSLAANLGNPASWVFLLPDSVLERLAGKPRKKVRGQLIDASFHLICVKAGDNPLGKEGDDPEEVRKRTASRALDLAIKPSRSVRTLDYQVETGDGAEIRVRQYVPKNWNSKTSLLYIHGGGWVLGDLTMYDPVCAYIAEKLGVQVFSVEYRLAPEHPFPVPLQDCLAAWKWVLQTHNCAPENTLVAGDSAGGNLATALCLHLRDNGEPMPALQLLIYPATDPSMSSRSQKDFGKGFYLTREAMLWFWNCYLPDKKKRSDPLAAPIKADLKDLPKALVVVAGFDPLMDEGREYAKKLRSAGVDCTFQEHPFLMHAFINMSAVPVARKAFDQILERTRLLLP